MDHNEFRQLYSLMKNRKWIEAQSEGVIELWNDCNTDIQRNLIADLLNRFKMLNSDDLDQAKADIANYIVPNWSLEANKTVFYAVSDDAEVDGSQAFLQMLKNEFSGMDGWGEKNFRNSLIDYKRSFGDDKTYVLFDDFFGTGKTIFRKAEKFKEYVNKSGFSGNRIFLLAIAGMEASKSNLIATGLEFFCPIWEKKGISDHYESSLVSKMIIEMKQLEKGLQPRLSGQFVPTLGYGKSESIFSIQNFNCPNNVFPIFWWPAYANKTRRRTILRRLR